jgi:hypothetical protein
LKSAPTIIEREVREGQDVLMAPRGRGCVRAKIVEWPRVNGGPHAPCQGGGVPCSLSPLYRNGTAAAQRESGRSGRQGNEAKGERGVDEPSILEPQDAPTRMVLYHPANTYQTKTPLFRASRRDSLRREA